MLQVVTDTAAVLATLGELNEPVPASIIYVVLGMDMERYTLLIGALTRMGLVEVKSHLISLTENGRSVASAINSAIESTT